MVKLEMRCDLLPRDTCERSDQGSASITISLLCKSPHFNPCEVKHETAQTVKAELKIYKK